MNKINRMKVYAAQASVMRSFCNASLRIRFGWLVIEGMLLRKCKINNIDAHL